MPRAMPELYRPDHLCPRCGSEAPRPAYHREPVIVVFGGSQWPCFREGPDLGEHFCTRCEHCGYAWIEAVAPRMAPPE